MSHGAEAFWLLTDPFEERPDVRFLIPTRPVRTALAQIEQALATRPGWVVVLGTPGVGKSVLAQLLVEAWGAETPVALVYDAGIDPAEISRQIHEQLADAVGGAVTREALRVAERAGRRPVVLLDGAEDLSEETVRDLEATWSASDDDRPARQLVDFVALVRARPEDAPPGWAVDRRTPAIVLEPLEADDTVEYVRRRIRLAAGGERELFDAGALDEVGRLSDGVPDAVNRLCALALDRAAAAGSSHVGSEDVRAAAAQLGDLSPAVHDAIDDAESDPYAEEAAEETFTEPPPQADETPPEQRDAFDRTLEAERAGIESLADRLAPRPEPPAPVEPPPTVAPRADPTRTEQAEPLATVSPPPATRSPTSQPEAHRAPAPRPSPPPEPRRGGPATWVVVLAALGGSVIGALLTLLVARELMEPERAPAVSLPDVVAAPRVHLPGRERGATPPQREAAPTPPPAPDRAPSREPSMRDEDTAQATEQARRPADEETTAAEAAAASARASGTPSPPSPSESRPAGSNVAGTAAVGAGVAAAATTASSTSTLPPVGAPPPAEAALPPIVREKPARVALPLDQGGPTLERAFANLTAAGTAWSVEIFDVRAGGPVLIERVELAHDEIDGRLHTLGSVAGEGNRRRARLLDRGEDATGRKARVFWPDDRVVTPVAADDPFAGTGFHFADFRRRRAAEFDVVAFEGDEIDGVPIFRVTAIPLGEPAHARVEIEIAERDERALELRWYDVGAEQPVRRLALPKAGAGLQAGPERREEWRLYGPGGREIARARIEVDSLPEDVGPELFTFSRLANPAFSVPRR